MIQGKTTIELTNVRTGKKQVIEEHNMVTNAVKDVLENQLYTSIKERAETPLLDNYFNGIVLFENTIEENTNNYFLPSNNTIVGTAGKTTTATKYIGVLNTEETMDVLDEITGLKIGKKYVWDFPTSCANGNISAVCMAPAEFTDNVDLANNSFRYVKSEYTNIFKIENDTAKYGLFMDIDYDNNVGHGLKINSETVVSLGTYRIPSRSIGIVDSNRSCILLNEKELTLSTPLKNYSYAQFGIDENNYYIFSTYDSSGTYNKNILRVIKINRSSFSVISDEFLQIPFELKNFNYDVDKKCATVGVIDGYVYLLDKDNTSVIRKMNLLDVNDYIEISTNNYFSYAMIRSVMTIGKNLYCYDFSIINDKFYTNHIHSSITGLAFQYCKGEMYSYSSYSYNYSYCWSQFIALLTTINNLASPVTKTNEQTMKITYTITEV